jgi:hypothetical protein
MATVTQRPKPDFELDLRQDIRTGFKMLQKKLALEGYGLQPRTYILCHDFGFSR